jgi:hypothetical protein
MLARLRIQRKTNAAVERAQAENRQPIAIAPLPVRHGRNRAGAFTGVTQIPVPHQSPLNTVSAVRNAAVGRLPHPIAHPRTYFWCLKRTFLQEYSACNHGDSEGRLVRD